MFDIAFSMLGVYRYDEFIDLYFDIAFSMLGVYRYDEFIDLYNDREQKEKPQAILQGKSPRQFMIWISEEVMKPAFGEQYFGNRMVEQVHEMYRDLAVVISDGGFTEEIKPLIKAGHEVHICRLHREGFTFDGDSRNYIDLSGYHHRVKHYDFTMIDGDPEKLLTRSSKLSSGNTLRSNSTNC
ncbi:UNVERIFIED_ASMBLY: hypothetical protein SD1_64 [Shigella phage 2019SD1]|uniref:Uncharacterized protein n=1 Tax=Shigella phage 2019SD1 TaxID=2848074 RepID=A0A6M5CDK8_9CAUD|nr:deoxynucleoside monophosphate kinase [Shigella phage 2019SD1]